MEGLLLPLLYIHTCVIFNKCIQTFKKTLSFALYTIFPVIKLDLIMKALLLDYILALEKIRVRLACILFLYINQYFSTFLRQNIQQKVLVFHSVLLGACLKPFSKRADTILYYYFHIKKNILKCFKGECSVF